MSDEIKANDETTRAEEIERAMQTAIIWGANELAKMAPTLGEKVFWRLLRENATREFVRLGGKADMASDSEPTVLTLPGPSFIAFKTRDIELMRVAVAEHDAKQGTVTTP